jgi:hypothetical protein
VNVSVNVEAEVRRLDREAHEKDDASV